MAAAAGTGYGQSTTQGAISGTVFDAGEAVIANASVTIRNVGTNAEQKLTADGSGYFKAPQLDPGTYVVTFSAPGFSETRASNVVVQVNGVTELNQHLANGAETTTVDVTAQAPVLNFDSPVYGGHLSNLEIESIPINNRRWSSLALTTPGVTNDTSGFGLLSFRAISSLQNNVEIDGADDNQAFFSEERGRTRAGYSTAQVAVSEFQVNTGVYSAEFGRAVGGVVNSITKSGSNKLHGELYFYNRDDGRAAFQPLATNTVFVPTNPQGRQFVTSPYKPKDKRNQYGFGVGGPLIKDRVFFFYAFDQFKRNFPGTAKANNPGTFFATPTALATGQTCNAATGGTTGGASAVNTSACLLAARTRTTYTAAAATYTGQLQSLLSDLGSVPRYGDQTINTPRLDWQVTSKHHVSGLYHRLRWDSPGGVQTQGTNNYAVDSFGTDFVKLDYGLAKLESIFTPKLVNELRYQYGRELNNEGRQTPSDYTNRNLTNATGIPTAVSLFTSIGFTLGTPYYSFRTAYPDERKWQIGDTASLLLGKHSIKFGEDIVHNYDLQNNLYQGNGSYNYTSIVNYMSDIVTRGRSCNASGSGVGNFPCYSNFTQGVGPTTFDLNTTDIGVFVQDDWKVTPRLTVNLGARYDLERLPAPYARLTTLPFTANHPSDGNNIAPRVGFAWDPYGEGKTVLRGGYGMYYGRIINATLLNAYTNTGSAQGQQQYSFSSSTPNAPLLPGVYSGAPPSSATGPAIQYLNSNLQNPMTHQFDLAVQQNIGQQTVLSVSYVGALGRQLPNYLNFNLDPANVYTTNYVVGGANGNCGPLACGTVLPTKVYANRRQTGQGLTGTGTYNFNTPYPAFGAVSTVLSNINSSYNGLTAEVQKRQNKYLSFDANYTWAHALDFNQASFTSAGANNWFDPFANARSNYGNSSLNVKHRVVGWAVLNAPGLEGKGIALKYLTAGWSLKPLIQAQSGLPYSVLTSGTTPNQCYNAGCLESNSSGLGGTGVTYIPQIGRNTLTYPRTILVDLRVQKEFTFFEKYNLQLIGESFNLANHQNVTGVNTNGYNITTAQGLTPATTVGTLNYAPTFGSVTSANSNYAYGPRQVQLAARLVF